MIVKSSKGSEFNVSENLSTDFRFMCAYAAMRTGDPERAVGGAVNMVALVLGRDEDRFLREIAEEDGTVPVDKVFTELKFMLDQASKDKSLKNS